MRAISHEAHRHPQSPRDSDARGRSDPRRSLAPLEGDAACRQPQSGPRLPIRRCARASGCGCGLVRLERSRTVRTPSNAVEVERVYRAQKQSETVFLTVEQKQ